MKKQLLVLLGIIVSLLSPKANAQSVDGRSFAIDGFAAMEGVAGTSWYHQGDTTGGAGGKVVKAETFPQLQAYLQSSEPYIVMVDKNMTTGIAAWVDDLSTGHLCDLQDGSQGVATTYGERIMVASNKTLIGIADSQGRAPLFERITFVIQSQSNVIIRNCRFTMNGVPILKSGENKIVALRDGAQIEVGDPDCIGIQADKESAKTNFGSHIWVDHCEFFNGNAANKDRYDGLLDCKNNVQWLTFSYNLFHNHDKSCLWGKGDSDVFDGCRTISCHHNMFQNIEGSRLPLQRGGKVHYMNNCQDGCQDGWDLRTESTGYADACYFKNTKCPIIPDGGGVLTINQESGYGIVYDNCLRRISGEGNITLMNISKTDQEFPASQYATGTWKPEQTDSRYFVNNHDPAMDVPAILEQYAGAGKVEIWTAYANAIPQEDTAEYQHATTTQLTAGCYDEQGNKVSGIAGSATGGTTGGGSGTTGGTGESSTLFNMEISAAGSDVYVQNTTDQQGISAECSTLTGGTVEAGIRQNATSQQKIIGKDSSERHLRFPKNDLFVLLTLNEALQAGDVITFTGNNNLEIAFMADATYSSAEATQSKQYTLTAASPLVGKSVIYVSRAQSSNVYVKTLTITRPLPTAIGTINASGAAGNQKAYDLSGMEVRKAKKGQVVIKGGRKVLK